MCINKESESIIEICVKKESGCRNEYASIRKVNVELKYWRVKVKLKCASMGKMQLGSEINFRCPGLHLNCISSLQNFSNSLTFSAIL